MKNPLPASLWFLRHDAAAGLLEQNGFVQTEHPDYDHPIYAKDGFHVYAQGFWYDRGDHNLVYRNPSRSFYRLSKLKDPLQIPGLGEERVKLEEGFKVVERFLQAHESFVTELKGTAYRPALIQKMPRAEQRYAKNWKVLFRCERRSLTM